MKKRLVIRIIFQGVGSVAAILLSSSLAISDEGQIGLSGFLIICLFLLNAICGLLEDISEKMEKPE